MVKRVTRPGNICVMVGAVLLILNAETGAKGVQEGLELCLQAVVPSLFPFIFLSGMLNQILVGRPIAIVRPLGRICKVPANGEGLLLAGWIGGYPVGAALISDAYKNGALSKADAQRMIGFCNNPGPAFIFGMLGPLLPNPSLVWVVWILQLASSAITGMLIPGITEYKCSLLTINTLTFSDSLTKAIRIMANVCGWVILFRVILSYGNQWILWRLPKEIRVMISGFLELSNGCHSLKEIASPSLLLIMAGIMLSFGGICVGMQTVSVCGSLGAGMYFPGKVLQCSINCILSTFAAAILFPTEMTYGVWGSILLSCMIMTITLMYMNRKKVVAFCHQTVYNEHINCTGRS